MCINVIADEENSKILLTQANYFGKLLFKHKANNENFKNKITRIYSEIWSESFYRDTVKILTMSEIIIHI